MFAAPPNIFTLAAIIPECGSEFVFYRYGNSHNGKIVGLIHELTLHIVDLILSLKLVSFLLIKLAEKLKAVGAIHELPL
ncbi:MAG: hypothetical protein ACKOQ2_20215, partial [Dolichospermum sp.]